MSTISSIFGTFVMFHLITLELYKNIEAVMQVKNELEIGNFGIMTHSIIVKLYQKYWQLPNFQKFRKFLPCGTDIIISFCDLFLSLILNVISEFALFFNSTRERRLFKFCSSKRSSKKVLVKKPRISTKWQKKMRIFFSSFRPRFLLFGSKIIG